MLNHHNSVPNSSSSSTPPKQQQQQKQKTCKNAKSVSFSNEVSKVDGNSVTIHEAQGGIVSDYSSNALLGRTIVGIDAVGNGRHDHDAGADDKDDTNWTEQEEGGALYDVHPSSEASGMAHDNHFNHNNDKVVDNRIVVVRMGLLKCGHRYRVHVPIPDDFIDIDSEIVDENGRKDDVLRDMHRLNLNEGQRANNQEKTHADPRNNSNTGCRHRTEVRIIQDSWDDDDLRGDVVKLEDGTRHVSIALSARQRGPYRGKVEVEFVPHPIDNRKTTPTSRKLAAESWLSKSIMTIVVEASIMGKGMGTPKLRNGVSCLGKLVGYDSDEETEWQGFG
ncbi:hypothetical protein HJC23_007694 [Cyclotella cryptica]|uniref:Adipose-secreted signaling protein n=1 Tax=Cyclotella cryptica TaxID=29204 RepID=A0ABD3PWK2_9STRA|eukprot:CCRYP_012262-RA/>CCRYP_012262-RA protein AED:0.21 eAED:0.21 QI:0/-1/0/1/-1/1/1/0/333